MPTPEERAYVLQELDLCLNPKCIAQKCIAHDKIVAKVLELLANKHCDLCDCEQCPHLCSSPANCEICE